MKFSIITATYNSETTLQDCLDSVKNQSWPYIEHIIIDGASSDQTVQIAKAYADKSTSEDRSVQIFSEPDKGLYDALNKGVMKASCDIIGFVHSDDLLNNDQVLEQIHDAFLQSNADGIYGDLLYVNQSDIRKIIRTWKSGVFHVNKLKYGWMPAHPALYLKKAVYDKFGLFDLAYKISADYDFILRVFGSSSIKFSYLPQTIVRMRMGGESNSGSKNMLQKSKEDYQILKKNHLRFPLYTLMCKNIRKIPQFF
jgi:glycosyltransferase